MSDSITLLEWRDAVRLGPSVAGGKGAQLGQLAEYGLPVGDGNVVPVGFYRALINGDLQEAALRAAALPADQQAQALQEVQRTICASELPASLRAGLDELLARKGWQTRALAVRSSAPGEDSARASFAGVHDSALNVVGRAALERAIAEVWASLWSVQAVNYRKRLGWCQEEAAMAVVIMPMVAAKASGVAFTCDPRSGREDRVVISSVRGLGEALMSGQVAGEDLVLELDPLNQSLNVIDRCASQAAWALEPLAAGGLVKRALDADELGNPVLSDAQAVCLGELALDAACAMNFSAPWFDIEWVWDGNLFHLVQARAVTVRPWHTYQGLRGQASIWTNGNSSDALPHVFDACDLLTWKVGSNAVLEASLRLVGFSLLPGAQRFALIQGRAYFNASLLQWEAFHCAGVSPQEVNHTLGGHQPEISVAPLSRRARWAQVPGILRFLARNPGMLRRGIAESERVFSQLHQWRATDMSQLGREALLQRRLDTAANVYLRHPGLAFLQGGGPRLTMLVKWLGKKFPEQGNALAAALIGDGARSTTAQQGHDLLRLAKLARSEPAALAWLRGEGAMPGQPNWLPADGAFAVAVTDFLARYGHRGIYESYSRSPRWSEVPASLCASIAGLLEVDTLENGRPRQTGETAWRRIAAGTAWWERALMRILLRRGIRDNNLRELARSSFTALGQCERGLLLAIGAQLCADGVLRQREDVFHLTVAEQIRALRGELPAGPCQARIGGRILMAAQWEKHPAPDVVVEGGTAAAPRPEPAYPADVWRGVAVASGYVEGTVRLLDCPDQHHRLAPGEILVTWSTDPSWVPLFMKAGGLIIQNAGFLSHGAIVAREFGIPAVSNLPSIMSQLRDGDRVGVDGERGMVTRLAAA